MMMHSFILLTDEEKLNKSFNSGLRIRHADDAGGQDWPIAFMGVGELVVRKEVARFLTEWKHLQSASLGNRRLYPLG